MTLSEETAFPVLGRRPKNPRAALLALAALLGCAAPLAAAARAAARPVPAGAAARVVPFRTRLPLRGLYVQFEERGSPAGYWSGQLIQSFDDFDPAVGHTVKAEAALQLDAMKDMGVNLITFELRAADPAPGDFVPPQCTIPPVLGLQWPQPTATELARLKEFFDLVDSKGMRIFLRLVNTHMEEDPPTNAEKWLGAILGAVKDHPALDLVLFEGDAHLIDTNGDGVPDSCGVPAEPNLLLGPTETDGRYVEWAIGFAESLGIPPRKLSAEAAVGLYWVDGPPSNPFATDGHLWDPVATEKAIFDDLGIPDSERTYALSLYEHRKCLNFVGPCAEESPHAWTKETLDGVFGTIGSGHRGGSIENGARIVAPEMGDISEAGWPAERALESLVALMEEYGVEGGSFWRWTSFVSSEDADPTLADPVKRRGVAFAYNPVEKIVLDMGGVHLPWIPNGSFESGGAAPVSWTAAGAGTAARYFLAGEAGEPEVPSRGDFDLRLTTGGGPNDRISASSPRIAAAPGVLYTTTFDLRFAWTGDPSPSASPASRPQAFVAIHYFDGAGNPSAVRAQDVFRFFQEDATQGFGTFPLRYTPPPDAASVSVEIGAARNGLPSPITLDADDVR